MNTLSQPTTITYLIHGLSLSVVAEDRAVQAAMELRLRSFPVVARGSEPGIRFEFAVTADGFRGGLTERALAGREPAVGRGRPVYETPYGSLYFDAVRDLLFGELGGVALSCSAAAGQALVSAADFRGRALYFATHPVTTVALMELMERRRRFSLHAACMTDSDGTGLLVCGPSGAGKSTLTLALARTDLGFLADDTVFLEHAAGHVQALAFPDVLGIGEFAEQRFPELAQATLGQPAEGFPKRLHRYETLFGRVPATACIPRILVFPEVRPDAASAVTSLDGGEALLRLAPDVLLTDERATRSHFDAIGALLAQSRCYVVRSGHDIEHAAALVRALLG
jgi:hypothetical protein